jgi:hypothetical protein
MVIGTISKDYRVSALGMPSGLPSPGRRELDSSKYIQVAMVNGIVSGHRCGSASTLGDVRDAQVQRQLFLLHPAETQAQRESP